MFQRQKVGPGILAVLLFSGFKVHGQTAEEIAQRRKLMREAETARKSEDHEKALKLALQAGSIQMSPSLRLFIAEELTSVGQPMDSLIHAQHCVTEATGDKQLRNREKILSACEKLIAELKRTSAQVVISMPTPLPADAKVAVGGRDIDESIYGQPYLLAPGEIKVDASAPGCVDFHREITLAAGEQVNVEVQLPPISPPTKESLPPVAAAPLPMPKKESPPSPAVTAPVVPPPQKTPSGRVWPYVTVGLGAAGLATSGTFFLLRNSAVNKLEAECRPPERNQCPDRPNLRSLQQTASTDNTIANISLGVGAAALTGGVLWLLLGKSASSDEEIPKRVQIVPTAGGAIVGVGSTF